MNSFRRRALLAVLLLTLTACQSGTTGGGGDDQAAPGTEQPAGGTGGEGDQGGDANIIVVTHGQASDPFWSVVKNGVDQAASDYGVNVQYQAPETFDMVRMSQLIEGAVAQQPDGLAVSIPDADALGGPIRQAVEADIPVISINSGDDVALDLGVLAHIGQSEREAGFGGGQRLAEEGVTNGLCINHEQGNVALELRCEGFAEALEQAGGQVTQLAVNGNDPTDAQQRIEAAFAQDDSINGGLAVGPLGMGPTLAALRNTNRLQDVTFGSFDLGEEILQAIVDGELAFAIDQQQYLQGYLAVASLAQNARIGVHPVGIVQTGPAFVTDENAAQVIDLSKEGIR
ncbi:MAG: sugar ABC transporter substrate-binding protein [Egibacteraceae bacterium]